MTRRLSPETLDRIVRIDGIAPFYHGWRSWPGTAPNAEGAAIQRLLTPSPREVRVVLPFGLAKRARRLLGRRVVRTQAGPTHARLFTRLFEDRHEG